MEKLCAQNTTFSLVHKKKAKASRRSLPSLVLHTCIGFICWPQGRRKETGNQIGLWIWAVVCCIYVQSFAFPIFHLYGCFSLCVLVALLFYLFAFALYRYIIKIKWYQYRIKKTSKSPKVSIVNRNHITKRVPVILYALSSDSSPHHYKQQHLRSLLFTKLAAK